MTGDLAPLLLLVAGAAAGGLIQGISGFAFGMTALSFWAWGLDPAVATVLAVFGGLTGQLVSLATTRRRPPFRALAPLVAGGLVGIPIGVTLLAGLDPAVFRMILGAVLAVSCPLMLLAGRAPKITGGGALADAAAGLLGGLASGIGGVPGVVSSLWCVLRDHDKALARDIIQGFNLIMLAASFAMLVASGAVTAGMWPMFAVVALALLWPALLGKRIHAGLDPAMFRRIVLVLLSASGVAMLAAGLSPFRS